MNNASTADGGATERRGDAEPFFPSEGTFNPVVPLSEVGSGPVPAPLARVDAAHAGKPAEAAWAREAHRAAHKEDEETLVPKRRRGAHAARRPWLIPAAVITLSVLAGLASGTYLIRSTQRAPEAQTPPQVAAEAPAPPPAPVAEEAAAEAKVAAEEVAAEAKVEKVNEAAREDKPGEVAKAEGPRESARPAASDEPTTTPRPAPPTRAERPARAAAEARAVTPAPKPPRTESPAPPRTRVTTAAKQTPAPSGRALPISNPPPSAKSKRVIQWP